MICGAMQLQAMRVSGLIGAPCCGRRCLYYYFSVGQILDLKRGDNNNKRRRSGERREGWKEKEIFSWWTDTAKTEGVWNVSSLFQLKGGGVEVSQNEWHRKLCHGQKEWAKQWDSHHQIKVH